MNPLDRTLSSLCLAHLAPHAFPPANVQNVLTRMLMTRIGVSGTFDDCLLESLTVLRRGFGLEFGAAFLVMSAARDRLSLIATEGLPKEFDEIASILPLPDYAEIADLPYNAAHLGCWGDFFAPVAHTFSMRAWLFLSIYESSETVRASLLLGSRSGSRFDARDTAPLFSIAQSLPGLFLHRLSRLGQ